jgi:predicted nucleic acid-binding protein
LAIYYFDSSALVKRYVTEVGTNWVVSLTDPIAAPRLYVASLAEVEVTAAIMKRVRMGHISARDESTALADFQHDLLNQYNVLQVTKSILASATAIAKAHPLRAYDAVQLAVVLALNKQVIALAGPIASFALTLISADVDLNNAAVIEGLMVDDPNSHP